MQPKRRPSDAVPMTTTADVHGPGLPTSIPRTGQHEQVEQLLDDHRTAMIAPTPTCRTGAVVNRPSDAAGERPVGDALLIMPPQHR